MLAGHKMSAILEETGESTRIILPKQLEAVDDNDEVVEIISAPTVAEPNVPFEVLVEEQHVPSEAVGEEQCVAQFHVGSKPNVVFVLSENYNKEDRLNTFYVLLKDHAAVMVRSQSNATLEELRDHLLQRYPDCGLVTPTFSSQGTEKCLGKYIFSNLNLQIYESTNKAMVY